MAHAACSQPEDGRCLLSPSQQIGLFWHMPVVPALLQLAPRHAPPPPCPRTHGCLRGVYCCMCVVHVQWATVKACRSGPVPVPDHILCCHATHPQAQSALGNKWTDIARLVNGRSNSAVKNHWNVQSKELFACGTLNNRWAVLCPPTFLRQPPLLLLSCVCQHSTSMPGASDDVSHFRYKGVVCFTRWSGWTTHGRCWRWCWC